MIDDLDITSTILKYRDCCCIIWNDFRKTNNTADYWDQRDLFDELSVSLFSLLVLFPLGLAENVKKGPSYLLWPLAISDIRISLSCEQASVMITRNIDDTEYWDYPLNYIKDGDLDLRFVDLFDFDRQGVVTLMYCRARIFKSVNYPNLVGHDVLLNIDCCRWWTKRPLTGSEEAKTGSEKVCGRVKGP